MKKSANRKKPFRRRTRKNKGSRKIKGGGFGWDNAIQFIENNTLTVKDTMFKFIGPDIPNSNNKEYFTATTSVTKSLYSSFATIELTAENFDNDIKLTKITDNTAKHLNKLNICKFQPSNVINLVKIVASYRSGETLNCNKLNIYKPGFGRTHSNWFWNEWLQDIKMCSRAHGATCVIVESSAPVSTV